MSQRTPRAGLPVAFLCLSMVVAPALAEDVPPGGVPDELMGPQPTEGVDAPLPPAAKVLADVAALCAKQRTSWADDETRRLCEDAKSMDGGADANEGTATGE